MWIHELSIFHQNETEWSFQTHLLKFSSFELGDNIPANHDVILISEENCALTERCSVF